MFLLLVSIILFLVIVGSGLRMIREAKKTGIPGPTPIPLLGNGHLFVGDSVHFLRTVGKLTKQYGNIIRAHVLDDHYVLLSDPKIMEPLLSSTEHITKGKIYQYLHAWLGRGLLTAGGQRWKSHRKFLTPAFHFNILQSFLPIFHKNDRILVEKIKGLADGRPVDVFPIVALAALDNVSESAMGVQLNAQSDSESEYVKAISEISEIISLRMFNFLMSIDLFFNLHPLSRTQKKALKILHSYTNKVIDNRRKVLETSSTTLANYDSELGIKNKCPFLDLLLLAEIDGKKLDGETIREEVDTFMFEGHDTTASAISFALYCISNNTDVQDKILEEQREILGEELDKDPSFSELQQMKYLELVIRETLRLYPSVPLFARYLNRDVEIQGYKISKHQTVIMDAYHMQRSEDNFEDPLEFRPERFEASKPKHAYSWVAFSAGPRNCIGQKFAMLEMKEVLSKIVKNFHLLPSGVEPMLGFDLILRSKNGIMVRFEPRPKHEPNLQ